MTLSDFERWDTRGSFFLTDFRTYTHTVWLSVAKFCMVISVWSDMFLWGQPPSPRPNGSGPSVPKILRDFLHARVHGIFWTPAPPTDRHGRCALCLSQLSHRGRPVTQGHWNLKVSPFYRLAVVFLVIKLDEWKRFRWSITLPISWPKNYSVMNADARSVCDS